MAFQTAKWQEEQPAAQEHEQQQETPDAYAGRRKREGRELREQIKHRLWDEGETDLGNKLAGCGLPMPLVCTNCGSHKTVETQCKQRWCPSCAWSISQKRLKRFAGAVKLMKWPAMITLTRANSTDPETLRTFRTQWAKMRRRKIIIDKVRGGVVGIEITNIGQGWHPHLHAIIDCRWLAIHTPEPHWSDSPEAVKTKCQHAQAELAWLWGKVCGQDNSHVYVKRVTDTGALTYALKYSIKGTDLLESPEPIGPMLRIIAKTRLVSAFGTMHGLSAQMEADERPAMVCECCKAEKSLCPAAVIYYATGKRADQKTPLHEIVNLRKT